MRKMGDRSELYWLVGAVAATVCVTLASLYFPAVAGLLMGPVFALAIFAKRPKLGFALWLFLLAAIPCWIGLGLFGTFVPATLIGSVVALACLFGGGVQWKPGKADLAVVTLLIACALAVYIGSETGASSTSAYTSMFTLWVPGYLVGRFVCERAGVSFVTTATAITFGVVGALALAEKALSWHPFSGFVGMNLLADIWAPIQIRGGQERSEWAFGHSIALGGSLALAIPFVVSSSLKLRTKVVSLTLILGGVGVTFSRGAMLAAGLTLALSLLTTKHLKAGHKVLLVLAAAGLGVFTASSYFSAAEDAGTETTDSSTYRISLFTRLIGTLEPFGRASSYRGATADGQTYYNNFTSIDNSFMALGLGFGWVAMLAVAIPFVVMAARFLMRRASFAEVALLGQLPVITTVAMITQYQVFVWMVAGLAATLAASKPADEPKPKIHSGLVQSGRHV